MKYFLILLCMATTLWAQTPTDNRSLVVANEFIQIVANNQSLDRGRFAIETTAGNPDSLTDNNQSLIFGRPLPWTSYTTILVDNVPVIFGGVNKKIQKRSGQQYIFGDVLRQERLTDGIQTVVGITQNVQATQTLRFFRNPSTKVNDAVLIAYEVHNQSEIAKKIGIRIMLDTKLGDNDGAPLRIGHLAVESEKQVLKKDFFPYWQAFDSLSSPNVVAQGVLDLPESGILPPDRVILANWGGLVDYPWEYPIQEGRSFIRAGETEKDTALALYWDPIVVAPKGKRTVKTLYGLGGLSVSSGALSLGLTAPAEYVLGSQRELLIVGYLANVGSFDAHNTEVSFTLPKGFVPVSGRSQFALGTVMRGQTKQIPLRVRLEAGAVAGKQPIVFVVKSTTLEGNRIERMIDVVAPPQVQRSLTLTTKKVSSKESEINVDLLLSNPGKVPVSDVIANIRLVGSVLPIYDLVTKSVDLAPGEIVTVNWRVRAPNTLRNPEISVALRSPGYPTEILRASATGVQLAPDIFVAQWPAGAQKKGAPVTLWLHADHADIPLTEFSIRFDPSTVRMLHYSPPEWAKEAILQKNIGSWRIQLPPNKVPSEAIPLGLLHVGILGDRPDIQIMADGYPLKYIPIIEVAE